MDNLALVSRRRSVQSGPPPVDVCSGRGQYAITRPHFFLTREGHAERHARTPCGGSHGVIRHAGEMAAC